MNHSKLIVLMIATFICLTLLIPMRSASAQVTAPKIAADVPIVTLWNVGGKVNLTVSQIPANVTYYVWLQRPADSSSKYTGLQLRSLIKSATFAIQVTVSSTDPAGTYVVSLSTSFVSDSRASIAHFGVYGTDNKTYQRTSNMTIAGGGFSPNSTVSVSVQVGGVALSGFPTNVQTGSRGDFAYVYRVAPSAPTGAVSVSATGQAYDSHNSTTAISAAEIRATSLTIKALSQPTSVERTTNATIVYSINYPDGSPVATSTANSTRIFVVNEATGIDVAEVPLVLFDANTGHWQAAWLPSPSTNLASYHFKIFPTDFDDSYGNLGTGSVIASESFGVIPAKVGLVFQGNSTLQRTQDVRLVAIAQYHTNVRFSNVTQAAGIVTDPDGTKHPLGFNMTQSEFIGHYNTTVDSPLGQVLVSATVKDLFGNTASGNFTIQVVKATTNFAVNIPTSAERTTVLNVSAIITYPGGSLVTPDLVPAGLNVTISKGNFTWSRGMDFNATTNEWANGYSISQNATLGDYSITMHLLDRYGNGGNYSGSSVVVPARFRFYLPKASQRVSPNTLINVQVVVAYPNGTALTPAVDGLVVASFANSSGMFTLPLVFNASDTTWHLNFTAPDPGLRFGLAIQFSFAADDQFGNTGSVAKAFELDVSAGTQALLLASIIGAVPSIALVGWAIATVSARRRKHKP